jgi:hypothetical protein
MSNIETLKANREIVEAYAKLCQSSDSPYIVFNNSSNANHLLELIDQWIKMDVEWGYRIPDDFALVKGEQLNLRFAKSRCAKNYKFNANDYYIRWDNGNVGAFQFAHDSESYRVAQPAYKEFKERLRSYNVLEEDMLNDYMVFSIEDGKLLMNDYKAITNETDEKISKAWKQYRYEQAKAMVAEMEKENNG